MSFPQGHTQYFCIKLKAMKILKEVKTEFYLFIVLITIMILVFEHII